MTMTIAASVLLPRVLEPEVMDTPEEARDYDAMDHRAVNRLFVDHLLQAAALVGVPFRPLDSVKPSGSVQPQVGDNAYLAGPNLLDVGTGTAQIPIELLSRGMSGAVYAVDLAQHMLDLAQKNVAAAGWQARIFLERIDAKGVSYKDGAFDVVMSNSIIHHIPEPAVCLREMIRLTRPGGLLFVRDLMRPDDRPTLDRLVEQYAGDANAHQKKMFAESLHAALRLDEIRALLVDAGLNPAAVTATSDRHWTIAARR